MQRSVRWLSCRMPRRMLFITASWAVCCLTLYASVGLAASQTYIVQPGDSLYAIARKHQTTIMDLRVANNIWTDHLDIGQILIIPGPSSNQPRIPFTEADLDLLARLVRAEAEVEPYLGQVAAAAVTINRVLDPRFPGTLYEVIYQQVGGVYQYEPVKNGSINRPAEESHRKAALDALYGLDPTEGALGFYNPTKVSQGNWVRQWPITAQIGNHVFFHL